MPYTEHHFRLTVRTVDGRTPDVAELRRQLLDAEYVADAELERIDPVQ